MQLSHELFQAELEERRRGTERRQLVRMATANRRRQPRIGKAGEPGGLLSALRRVIQRCTAWFTASQLGPLPRLGQLPDPDWSGRHPRSPRAGERGWRTGDGGPVTTD